MAVLEAPYEGAAIYADGGNEAVVFQNRIDLVYKGMSPVIVTAEESRVWVDTPMGSLDDRMMGEWNNDFTEYNLTQRVTVAGFGDDTEIYATANSTTATFGSNCNVNIGYGALLLRKGESVSNNYIPNTECFGLSMGSGSKITSESTVADSVLISHGENSVIDDEGMNNICIGTGENVDIATMNEDSKSTIFVTKESSRIFSKNETLLFAKTSPKRFEVGKNSAVAIAWNDGTRERISVFYEGEGELEADVSYRFENGALIKL